MTETPSTQNPPRMVSIILLLLYLLVLIVPLPELIGRTSGSSQAILGRYSTSYALILFSYIGYVLLWALIFIGEIRVRFLQRLLHTVLRNGGMALLGVILVLGYHLGLVLLFGIWNLSISTLIAALLAIPAGIAAVIAAAKPSAQTQLRANAIPLLFSTLISLLALEFGLRAVFPSGITQQNLIINYGTVTDWATFTGWAPRTNTIYYASLPDEFTAYIETNDKGLREHPTTYEKPEGVYRILIIGDSMTFGAEVPLEETYHEVFERLINEASDQTIEVIGAGGQGWSSDQQLLYLRHEGCRYEPDEVILQMTINDAQGNHNPGLPKPYFTFAADGSLELHDFPYEAQQSPLPTSAQVFQPFLRVSHLARILWQAAQVIGLNYLGGESDDGAQPAVTIDGENDLLWAEWEDWRELNTALIAAIRDEAAACGADFAAFVEPTIERIRPTVSDGAKEIAAGIMNSYYDSFVELGISHPTLAQMETPILDYLEANPDGFWDLTWRVGLHYSSLGYRMMGESLAEWYIETRLSG